MPDGWSYAQNKVNTKNGDAHATARAGTIHLDCVQADYRCSRRASWEHFHEVWEQSAQGFTEADYRREPTRQTGWSVWTSTRHTDVCLMDGRTGKSNDTTAMDQAQSNQSRSGYYQRLHNTAYGCVMERRRTYYKLWLHREPSSSDEVASYMYMYMYMEQCHGIQCQWYTTTVPVRDSES